MSFYPLMIGIYPVLALYAFNVSEINPSAIYRSLGVTFLLAGAVFLLIRWILKDWARAAYVSSWLLVLFYTYGHVYSYLEQHPIWGMGLGRHRLLAPAWLILGVAGFWLLLKKVRASNQTTLALNLICLDRKSVV